ncbi:hypothetical protein HO173_000953 [Letharia columbiana]|uniref:Uncharacterized protein n=1 Tax=Letharia columbiana TaxID=112416 RepID=A0A8H6LA43_9LECA|nr:uncharacterized protein HO173_000953 [Letharia columbiana]KAF6241159.1 hypothetical protein HO173_000953 [Letharia columbiana]
MRNRVAVVKKLERRAGPEHPRTVKAREALWSALRRSGAEQEAETELGSDSGNTTASYPRIVGITQRHMLQLSKSVESSPWLQHRWSNPRRGIGMLKRSLTDSLGQFNGS